MLILINNDTDYFRSFVCISIRLINWGLFLKKCFFLSELNIAGLVIDIKNSHLDLFAHLNKFWRECFKRKI